MKLFGEFNEAEKPEKLNCQKICLKIHILSKICNYVETESFGWAAKGLSIQWFWWATASAWKTKRSSTHCLRNFYFTVLQPDAQNLHAILSSWWIFF